ncbi:MAG TPA: ankyrin repeat domain-containing protein [Bryobacteraceae bacterium]|jgi:ankyrin repeat protein|nr:ankyrin repeat domain-containing protein [Bryobacteraceae bacterium]
MRKTLLAAAFQLSSVTWLLIPGSLSAQTPSRIRAAIARAIPPLEHSTSAFVAKRACVSCHHNVLSILMFHMARERGISVDPLVLTAVETRTFRSLLGSTAFDDAVQAVTLNDPTPDDSYLLMAAHASGVAPDLTTSVYARRLVHWQRDGHWVTSDFRPPHSSSIFTATATAVRAISLYMPVELQAERDACILRARQWLVKSKPASTEDGAFRLLGLVWSGATTREIDAARSDLVAMRKPAGGWAELPGYPADAYSTGESLFALHEAGMATADPVWRAGLSFLISTQAADGTWLVHTRMTSPAQVSPEYFTTGFPYGKNEYLSYAGSTWAVMAMLSTLPQTESGSHAVPESSATAPAWARAALSGTPAELTTLLDKGLDPNSKTAKGTTLLMAVADDAEEGAEKVRLLFARGAEPSYGALTVAAASRDTAASIKRLLDAGAPVNPPEGSHPKNNPLVLAAMTGDLENVELLLAHGSGSLSAALSQAVTFGYPDVVRTLLSAGASAKVTDSSGINLLHWAAIANRPQVISDLAKAGVAINARDDAGFTPLMYAATIDFGDTASLRALLKAGADPKIRNDRGHTATEQARQYRRVNLETILK